jgi:hypothetical protein
VANRDRYSRWRRLPPVFRSGSGEHKIPGPAEEAQRIVLYLPGAVLDQAEALAGKAGVSTLQKYCEQILGEAIEVERLKDHVAEVEARRGPLEGFNEISGDPGYLSEWRERSGARQTAASGPQNDSDDGPDATADLTIAADAIDHLTLPAQPEGDGAASETAGAAENEGTEDASPAQADEPNAPASRPRIRIEPARRAAEPVITQKITPEVVDQGALQTVLKHVGTDQRDADAFLPVLRRGQQIDPALLAELISALQRIELDQRGASLLERGLAYALHRLGLESQVLLTEAWPGVFDARTTSAIRSVQELVERILSGQDIRYYQSTVSSGSENPS